MTLLAFLSGFSSSAYPFYVLVTPSFACPSDEVVLSVWTVTGLFGLLPYTTRDRELLREDLSKHQQSSDMLRRENNNNNCQFVCFVFLSKDDMNIHSPTPHATHVVNSLPFEKKSLIRIVVRTPWLKSLSVCVWKLTRTVTLKFSAYTCVHPSLLSGCQKQSGVRVCTEVCAQFANKTLFVVFDYFLPYN